MNAGRGDGTGSDSEGASSDFYMPAFYEVYLASLHLADH